MALSGGNLNVRDITLRNIARTKTGWTAGGDATSTVADLDRSGGGFSFATDNTDNDCSVLTYGGEMFDFGDVGCRSVLSFKMQWDPAGADTGGCFIGFSDTFSDATIGDTDALGSQDAIGIFRPTNSAFFTTVAQNAASNSGELTTTALAAATEYNVRIEVEGLTGGLTIRFYVDENLIDTVTGFSYTNFGPELQLGVAIGNKGANVNTVSVYDMSVSHRALS